jgi:SAM-dependent methyltransferase
VATTTNRIREWERAEIVRSDEEAAQMNGSLLRDSEANIRRYLDPPANTCYPLEYAFHLLGDVRGQTVLDFGCGSGENCHLLARRGAHVWAMDISASLVQKARQRLALNGGSPNVRFLVASAHEIPLAAGSVDIVFGIAVLHHLDLASAAREIKRVLRPGGRAIFQEPVRNSELIKFLRGLIPYRRQDLSPYERTLTEAELREFGAGFTRYRSRGFGLPHINLGQVLPGIRDRMHPLYRLDGRILRRFPALEFYTGIRVIEMTRPAYARREEVVKSDDRAIGAHRL